MEKIKSNYVIFSLLGWLYEISTSFQFGNEIIEGEHYCFKIFRHFFHSHRNEICIFQTCISARLCQSLVMGAYTYSLDPGNSYLLTTASRGWTVLNKLWNETTDEQLENIWRNVFKQYSWTWKTSLPMHCLIIYSCLL